MLLSRVGSLLAPSFTTTNNFKKKHWDPNLVVFRDLFVLTLSLINPAFTDFILLCGQIILPSFDHLSYPG